MQRGAEARSGRRAERGSFALPCERWRGEGDAPVPGPRVLEMHGSKTPSELALVLVLVLVLEQSTLISGDLVRGHMGRKLNLLPDAKLTDRARAVASVKRIVVEYPQIEAVLVGNGWPIFHGGARARCDCALCESSMSRHHANLIRSLFHDSPSANVHWSEVESLLKHVGAAWEPISGARVRVKLNRMQDVLHRPHHRNALDASALLHLRGFLARAGVTPSLYEIKG